LTDVVGASDAALRLACFEALADLLLLVGREDRLAAEFDTVRLGVGATPPCAFEDAAALQFGGDAEDRKDDLGKIRGGIEVRFGQ
jgi:hypothetical protein